jgi:hypothetical protein
MPSISAPVVGGALAGAGGIFSGLLGYNASQNAAQAQLQAAQLASQTQLGIFNQTQANLQPYNTAGQSALSQLAQLFGLGPGGGGPSNASAAAATSALTKYPGYQFGLQQGNLAQQQSAASQGLLLSGSQLQAAQQFGQNYAMQNAWNPYVSQLNTLAQNGQNAGANLGSIGANTGANVAQTQLAAGQAAASGYVGGANALTGGLQSGLQNALYAYNAGNYGGGGGYVNPSGYGNSPLVP